MTSRDDDSGEVAVASGENDDRTAFQRLRFEAFGLLAEGRYGDALPIAVEAEARYPRKGEVPFWLACIHCDQGRPGRAVEALRGGLARGLWWPDDWLLEDDDLAPLRDAPQLPEIVAGSARNRRRGAAGPPVASVLAAGSRSGNAAPAAVVLALHGWGQEAPEFVAEWAGLAERGIAVVAPESTQEPTPGFFVWDDRDAALGTIAAQYETALERLAPQGAPLVVAGFSQGGGLAVDLAIDGAPAPSLGFLAVASGLDDLAGPPAADRLRQAAGRGLRGRLVVGAADEALEGARGLAATVAAAGVDCPLTVLPVAGHQMPDPGSGLLLAAVEALLT